MRGDGVLFLPFFLGVGICVPLVSLPLLGCGFVLLVLGLSYPPACVVVLFCSVVSSISMSGSPVPRVSFMVLYFIFSCLCGSWLAGALLGSPSPSPGSVGWLIGWLVGWVEVWMVGGPSLVMAWWIVTSGACRSRELDGWLAGWMAGWIVTSGACGNWELEVGWMEG